ncbi:unnamed protein product [Arabis nemorensis]|uniref:Uncharacterized protein n=1 Tax=Arabis nemorensis TaxID=586526 RepID=A0A565AZ64_9BRAS|nr:unnamed protein product [Arabis nemorensis]
MMLSPEDLTGSAVARVEEEGSTATNPSSQVGGELTRVPGADGEDWNNRISHVKAMNEETDDVGEISDEFVNDPRCLTIADLSREP